MKIRSYKGPSLDKLYEAIHNELGPEAVVVCQERSAGGLSKLVKGCRHELIAIVDDASADAHTVASGKGSAGFNKYFEAQDEKLQRMESMFLALRRDLLGGSGQSYDVSGNTGDDTAIASEWDPRFTAKVRAEAPEVLKNGNEEELERKLADFLNVSDDITSFRRGQSGPRVFVFAGPTGAGKTTTMAKLAAIWCLDHSLRVGLITMDTYRVAAVDQAKEYASLLGLDLRVVFSATEAARAVEYFSDRDVILVDTPGRNYYDNAGMASLRGMLGGMGQTTLMLLVPATLARNSVADLLKRFQMMHPDYLIITKVDEVRNLSVLSTITSETSCPVAFLTDGQRVPQDIRVAQAEDMAKLMVAV